MKNQSTAGRILAHLNNNATLGYFLTTSDDSIEHLELTEIDQTAADILDVTTEEIAGGINLSFLLRERLGLEDSQVSQLNSAGSLELEIAINVNSHTELIYLSLSLENRAENSSNQLTCTGIIKRYDSEEKRSDHSEKLLTATAKANTVLLETEQLEDAIFEAFKVIGKAAQVDRVYIFENYMDQPSQTLYCRQRMEWSRSSVTPQIDNENLQQFPLQTGIPRWYNTMRNGGIIQGLVRDFPKEEREALEPQDIISILVVPVTINEEFWGFVGFDDCSKFRSWNTSESAILKALASNVGLRYERHRVETELEQSRTVFQQIADTIDEVFYVADDSQNVLYVNSAIHRVFGITQKELMDDQSIFSNQIVMDDYETIREHMSMKTVSMYEFRYNHPNGTQRVVAAKRFPVLDSDGEIERVIGVLTDVTELKRAQLEMKANLEKEHELFELKNNFISMISHEIRTPITTIISTAEMLRDFVSKMDDEKRNEMIARVLGASRTIVNLLEDVLFIGKADASESRDVAREVNIEKVISQITAENVILARRENNIITSYNLNSKTLPFDESLIQHIVNNLVENASKYSAVKSEIHVEVQEDQNEIYLKVTDQGIGIDTEDFDKLFDPFYRSKSVADKEGTGLGLAVVKRATDALNGTIKVESEPGKGTSVTVSIPKEK